MNQNQERIDLLKSVGLIDAKDKIDTFVTIQALLPYTSEQIIEAAVYHKTKSPYVMKVCDVVNYWNNKTGQTPEVLEQKASLIYEKFFKYPKTGFDHVSSDRRAVYAFKVAFGTLTAYGSRSDYIEGIDKKDFVKAYINARPEDYELAGNVIEGRYHYNDSANPTVVCMDSQAKNIALKLYGNNVNIAGLPAPKAQAIVYKQKNKELPLSPQQIESAKAKISAILDGYLKIAHVN